MKLFKFLKENLVEAKKNLKKKKKMRIKEDYPHLISRLVTKFGYLKEVLLRILRRNSLIKCLVPFEIVEKILVHLLINLNSPK